MKFKSVMLSIVLAGAVISLSACQEKRDEYYYYTHTDTLRSELQACQKKWSTPETFDANCALVYRSAVWLTKWSQAFVESQTDFGQRILRSQVRVANTELQLKAAEQAHAPAEALKKQLAVEQQHVDNLRAVVALFIRI